MVFVCLFVCLFVCFNSDSDLLLVRSRVSLLARFVSVSICELLYLKMSLYVPIHVLIFFFYPYSFHTLSFSLLVLLFLSALNANIYTVGLCSTFNIEHACLHTQNPKNMGEGKQ